MQTAEARRATAAATAIAAALGLAVDETAVLSDQARLVVRLMPCDVVARVAPMAYLASSTMAVDVARRLVEAGSPVAALEPRAEPRVYVHDGFVIDLWTYHEDVRSGDLPPDNGVYARALGRLHAGMRTIDVTARHFTDRVAETEAFVANRELTPELSDADRELLASTLSGLKRSIVDRGAVEQILHGEPHPWNLLCTKDGLLFIDFDDCVRGPVEYDLGWAPREVSDLYAGADQDLVAECRGLMLAIVAAWRWRADDEHPSRAQRDAWLDAVRRGTPWLAIEDV